MQITKFFISLSRLILPPSMFKVELRSLPQEYLSRWIFSFRFEALASFHIPCFDGSPKLGDVFWKGLNSFYTSLTYLKIVFKTYLNWSDCVRFVPVILLTLPWNVTRPIWKPVARYKFSYYNFIWVFFALTYLLYKSVVLGFYEHAFLEISEVPNAGLQREYVLTQSLYLQLFMNKHMKIANRTKINTKDYTNNTYLFIA